jgi:hypothetical protein
MPDQSYYLLGQVGDAEVGVQPTLDGQDILIRHGDLGQRLACLLAMGQTEVVHREDSLFWRVHHSQEVDRLLMEVTDLFISIRYAHPTLVQLELELDEPAP